MKKSLLVAVVALALGFIGHELYSSAGNQYNWGTQYGGAWSTPNDAVTTVGQVIQIGPSGGAVAVAGGYPTSVFPRTLAQLNALTPGTTGQIAFCSDCTYTKLVISSGTGTGAWVNVSSSTVHAN